MILDSLDLEQIKFQLEQKTDFKICPSILFLQLRHKTLHKSAL